MVHPKLAMITVLILWITGVINVSASASQSVQLFPQAVPTWTQVNSSGFGSPGIIEVSSLEAFNGYLYAGVHNPVDPAPLYDGAQIFRSQNGTTWTSLTLPGFGIAHDIAPPAILDMAVFNGQIYATTGRGDGPGQIWRAPNGAAWAPMVIHGFNDPDTVNVNALAEYDGALYAGATNLVSGAQVYRSPTGDSNTWVQVAPATPGTGPAGVVAFAVFDGGLWAAVESDTAPVQIWNTYGGDWTTVVSDGFGNSATTTLGGMAVFGGYLYVGAGNTSEGAQLWRTNDGTTWDQIITPAFGDPHNLKVETVFVFQDYLYAGAQNTQTGIELWRSPDGLQWEQANSNGFGDSNNTTANRGNATANFLGHLYQGTANAVDGGEIWRIVQNSTFLPFIVR